MDDLAAAMCSDRIRSTVELNSGKEENDCPCPGWGVIAGGEAEPEYEPLRLGVSLSDCDIPRKSTCPFTCGVPFAEVIELFLSGRRRASEAAWIKRLVVPSAFVDPDRAEQTTATL